MRKAEIIKISMTKKNLELDELDAVLFQVETFVRFPDGEDIKFGNNYSVSRTQMLQVNNDQFKAMFEIIFKQISRDLLTKMLHERGIREDGEHKEI